MSIRVAGGDPGARRRLLAIIRYDFDRIHGEFKDRLEVRAKVALPDHPSYCVDYEKLIAFEKKGLKEFPELVGQQIVTVNVAAVLNGVDVKDERGRSVLVYGDANSVFFSYSHRDEILRDELETHLKLLQRQDVISTWHDRKILPGAEWDHEIDQRLQLASIILLLVSPDFIASDYCWDKEVSRAMERHEKNEARVVPIVLRACDWESAPFGKLQGLPTNAQPVTMWANRDAAWADVAKGIRAVATAK